jgi:hypothetical protein
LPAGITLGARHAGLNMISVFLLLFAKALVHAHEHLTTMPSFVWDTRPSTVSMSMDEPTGWRWRALDLHVWIPVFLASYVRVSRY